MPFLTQGNTNWKFLLIVIVLATIVGGGILAWLWRTEEKTTVITSSTSDKLDDSGVVISTDKAEYGKGEIIEITVENNLKIPIFYSSLGDRFWGITPFKDGFFQLTDGDMGEDCHMRFYERMPPVEVGSGPSISTQWDQKICFFEEFEPFYKPGIVKYIESGQYRIVFDYSLELSDEDPFKLLELKSAYSNSFIIK